ncbi:MAG TPA: PEP-CTERM sorting domain-containing protein [Candidatus Solibacter sp.]
MRNIILTIAILAVLPGAAVHAASVSVTLDFATLTAAPGQTVIFQGTLTNPGAITVDLNSCGVNPPAGLTGDCGAGLFFDNAPLSLGPGEVSGPYPLFSVTVDPNYGGPFGQVLGFFDVFGGLTSDADDTLAHTPFQVDVVPEPGTAALLALALPVAFVLRRRAARS